MTNEDKRNSVRIKAVHLKKFSRKENVQPENTLHKITEYRNGTKLKGITIAFNFSK